MRLWISILAITIVLGVFVFFISLSARPGQSQSQSQQSTTTPAIASVLEKELLLSKAGASSTPQEITASQKVSTGDKLQTSHTGRGLLQDQNGTETVLDYDTTMIIAVNDGEGHVSNFLGLGSLWARVEKVFGKGEYYEIETQNAVAVARGTSYGVSYFNHTTTLEVALGTVGFIPVDPLTGIRKNNGEVLVHAGQKATADDAGRIRVSSLSNADLHNEWYLYNASSTIQDIPHNPKTRTLPQGIPSQSTSSPVQASTQLLLLKSLRPTSGVAGTRVLVSGSGFLKVENVAVGGNILPQTDVQILSDTSLAFTIPSLDANIYDVSVISIGAQVVTLPQALTIMPPPPQSSTTQGSSPSMYYNTATSSNPLAQ